MGGKAAFIWSGVSIVALVWVWFELPETKDKTFAELDSLFADETSTRRFTHAKVVLDPDK